MDCIPVSQDSLKKAAQILCSGGLVAFPTETVYGLGADAFNAEAIAKVFEAKNRPSFDPLIIHIAAIETLEKVADMSLVNKETRKKLFLLAENLWPGPLSIVLPKNTRIPGIATAGLNTAAIRFPGHEAAQKLISLSTGALAAPSANPFGSLSPTKAEHVRDKLGDKIDMILDGGASRIGLESTVIDITSGCLRILRPGGTTKEAIEKLIGQISNNNEQIAKSNQTKGLEQSNQRFGAIKPKVWSNENCPQVSPGLLKSHYAPRTPLFALSREAILLQPPKIGDGFLFFDGFTKDIWLEKYLSGHKNVTVDDKTVIVRVLSESGQ
ncbi:MAG: threonylcarbamoyl-AMP synthase, partial [Treponema sp.]|nr:threonylcarbamoyl-AMP synthase [Treponema sp.]